METSQPRNLFQSSLWFQLLCPSVFVVLFARPAWRFMPPGSYVQKPPTSTLGGTDDPNGTSREPRGWLQQTVTPGTLSSSRPSQTATFLGLMPEFGSACVAGWQHIQPGCSENSSVSGFNTEVWEDSRAREGEAVNQDCGEAVAEQPKTCPQTAPEHPREKKSALMLRRFFGYSKLKLKIVASTQHLPDPHQGRSEHIPKLSLCALTFRLTLHLRYFQAKSQPLAMLLSRQFFRITILLKCFRQNTLLWVIENHYLSSDDVLHWNLPSWGIF